MIHNFISKIYTDTASALQYHQLWRFTCAILVGILMVKAGWDKETVAIYELLFFAAHLLSFAWSTGVNNALLAYYPKLAEDRKGILLFNAAILMLTLSVFITSIFLLFSDAIMELLTDKKDLPFKGWIAVYLLCSPAAILVQSIYLLRAEPRKITFNTHVIFLLQLVIIAISILVFGTVKALVVGIVIWSAFKFLWLALMLVKYANATFDTLLFKSFGLFSIPLILQFILSNGMEYVDGIIVNQYFDIEDFPVFRYGSRELPITIILVVSLTSAMIPLAVQNLSSTLAEIKSRTRKLMHFLFPFSAILILVSPIIYSIVYSDAYIASAQLFNVYLLILATRILLPQVVIYAHGKNSALLMMTIVELMVNVGLSILWAQSLGMVGIAYATVVANICHVGMMIMYNKFSLKIDSSSYVPWTTYGVYLMVLLSSFFISSQIYSYG